MKSRKLLKVLAFILVLFVAVAGCQSIAGWDVNKAILSHFAIESFEGEGALSIELLWNEEAEVKAELNEDLAMLKLFDGLIVDLKHIKKQDNQNLSLQGSITYQKGEIPFHLNIANHKIIIQVKGADRPVVFDMYSQGTQNEMNDTTDLKDVLSTAVAEALEDLGGYLVNHFPNPEGISVSSGSEEINNENLMLHKLSMDIKADEILELIQQTLASILEDEAGLRQLIGQLYDLLEPTFEPLKEQAEALNLNPLMMSFIQNKELTVDFVYIFLKETLEPLLEDNELVHSTISGMEGAQFFNDESYLKTDLYFDNSLNFRKEEFEMIIAPTLEDPVEIRGLKITGSSEIWNVNQAVTIDPIDSSDRLNVLSTTKPAHFLKEVDTESVLYDLLHDDLQITHQELQLFVAGSGTPYTQNMPYISNSSTMVPARFVSEELNADVFWKQETQEVTIVDILTEREIVLTIGSDTAYVDGVAKNLPTKVELKNDSTFVPVRFIVESLGGEIDWDQETRMVTITKD